MNKLLIVLLLTSSTAFAGGYKFPTMAEQNERMRIEGEALSQRIRESIHQQNMQQLQQEQNDILRQQSDDYYFNNRNNNRNDTGLSQWNTKGINTNPNSNQAYCPNYGTYC